MIIFALDSAGKTAGVCIYKDDAVLYESYLAAGLNHSQTLLTLCDAALKATDVKLSDIDVLAANAGPGSFTGLRIGLAALKGLAFPNNTLCAGVSTLSALAYSVPFNCTVGAALDARRGEVYCAAFKVCNGVVTRLTDDTAMPAVQFAQKLKSLDENAICMGDGAHLVCTADNGIDIMPIQYRFGRANGICRAAEEMYKNKQCVNADALVPDYHRLSQAERERAERLKSEVNINND